MFTRTIMTGILAALVCAAAGAADPEGALERENDGWLEGWAVDPDDPDATLDVHFYAAADGEKPRIAGRTWAGDAREDLAGTGRQGHAFFWKVPAELCDGQARTVQAFALNVGAGKNAPLPDPVTFTLEAPKEDFAAAATTRLDVAKETEVWMCKANPWVLSASDEWHFVRDNIDCVVLYVDQVDKAGPEKLQAFAALQREAGFRVAVELGGLVDWEAAAGDQSGERSFACEFAKVRKFADPVDQGGAGGTVHWLNIDGPFRRMMYPGDKEGQHHTLESAGREFIDCLRLWREHYPDLRFNLLTNFPNYGWNGAPAYNNFGFAPGPQGWGDYRDVLDTALKLTRAAGLHLDGITIDAPFDYVRGAHASNQAYAIRDTDFMDAVRGLEGHARREGLKVRLIVNSETPARRDTGSDKAYALETLAYMDAYHARGGRPDAYIVQTWYPRPLKWLPEDEPWTMTNLVKAAIHKLRPNP